MDKTFDFQSFIEKFNELDEKERRYYMAYIFFYLEGIEKKDILEKAFKNLTTLS